MAMAASTVFGAQHGFSGTVSRPTVFMAGEAGAEHVQVTPHDQSGFAGGGASGGMSFTFNINALDSSDMVQAVEARVMPVILDQIMDRSFRGEPIVHSAGILPERGL